MDCDSQILAEVLHALGPVQRCHDVWLGVQVRARSVSLRGFVGSPAQRTRAVQAAQDVRGVRCVCESIIVTLTDLVARLDLHSAGSEITLHPGTWTRPSALGRSGPAARQAVLRGRRLRGGAGPMSFGRPSSDL